ncbi:hypothetical protein Slin14017_G051860 [Septoria linicola]|nr:hypothetical protein Slin14017_G051860 [Septoria linicola]
MSSPSDRRKSVSPATAQADPKDIATKAKDTRAKMPRTSSSTTSSNRSASPTSSYNGHQYLRDGKASDIASWTAGVPPKSTNPNGIMYDEVNPAVQAYMQMKMALFQSMSRSKQDKSSSSSSRNK